MRQLREHPLRTLAGLLALAFCFFMASGIPALKDATSGVNFVLGEIAWLAFMLLALLFLLGGGWILVRRTRDSRSSA